METEATCAVGLGGTSTHDIRHAAASLLIASGADVKVDQSILGHASATITMALYGHLSSDAPWRAMPGMPKSRPKQASNPKESEVRLSE